jgi:large conductance mechanosensitive channel
LSGFKKFLLRGNVIDLAIAVVIGAAFGAVVTALVKDLLTPLIGAIIGKPDFSQLTFTVNSSKFLYGDFINTVLAFIVIATAVYYFVVLPINALMDRYRPQPVPPAKTQQCHMFE